ncbi:MAG: hypothetical protein WCG81_09275 [Candidatus Angelobacter sp.]
MPYMKESRLKIERAEMHIHDIERRIAALHQTDTAKVEIYPEHGTERLIHTFQDPFVFDDLSLMIGDAVHNLKCALDYTWLQTIEKLVPANVDDRAKFPVRKFIEELKGFLRKGNIDTTCKPLFDFMVNEIQPCEGGNDAIWAIHNFDNRDKHRLLLPVLAQGHIGGLEVQDESGEKFPGFGVGDFQRPPYVIDFEKGLHVTKKGKLAAEIGVEDTKSGCFMHVPETLKVYSQTILAVVKAFEGFLQSAP